MSIASRVAKSLLIDQQSTVWGVSFSDGEGNFDHKNSWLLIKGPVTGIENSIVQQKINSIELVDTILDGPASVGNTCVIEFSNLTEEEASSPYFETETGKTLMMQLTVGKYWRGGIGTDSRIAFTGVLQDADWCYKKDGISIRAVYKSYVWNFLEHALVGNYVPEDIDPDKSLYWYLETVLLNTGIIKNFYSYVMVETDYGSSSIEGELVDISIHPEKGRGGELKIVTSQLKRDVDKHKTSLLPAASFYEYSGGEKFTHYERKTFLCLFGDLCTDYGSIVTIFGDALYFGRRVMHIPAAKVFVYGGHPMGKFENKLKGISKIDVTNAFLFDDSYESIQVDYKKGDIRTTDVLMAFDATMKMEGLNTKNYNQAKLFFDYGGERFYAQVKQIGVNKQTGENEYEIRAKNRYGDVFSIRKFSSPATLGLAEKQAKDLLDSLKTELKFAETNIKLEKQKQYVFRKGSLRVTRDEVFERLQLKKINVLDVSKRVTVKGAAGDIQYMMPKPFLMVGLRDSHEGKYSPIKVSHHINNEGHTMDLFGVKQMSVEESEWDIETFYVETDEIILPFFKPKKKPRPKRVYKPKVKEVNICDALRQAGQAGGTICAKGVGSSSRGGSQRRFGRPPS